MSLSQVRDVSIAQLKEEVQELRAALSKEPPSQSENKHKDNKEKKKTSDSSKDTPLLSHESSLTGQSERSTSLNGTPRVDAGTQADLTAAVDVEEMITGYTEKIGQMQELHAAEIMDMEARHISESESLKRERQQLEEQCGALRDALEKLRSAEVRICLIYNVTHIHDHIRCTEGVVCVVSDDVVVVQGPSVRSERPPVSPFKDGYTSGEITLIRLILCCGSALFMLCVCVLQTAVQSGVSGRVMIFLTSIRSSGRHLRALAETWSLMFFLTGSR